MTTRAEMSAELHRMLVWAGATDRQAAETILHLTEAERLRGIYLSGRLFYLREKVVAFADGVRERRLQDENTAET
jgi:hypothetical protein